MCATCGCSGGAVVQLLPAPSGYDRSGGRADLGSHDHDHDHDHEHGHEQEREHGPGPGHENGHEHGLGPDASHIHVQGPADRERTVVLQQKVLAKNDELAERTRNWLRTRDVLAVNLMSSPGAGKTTLLERTARELAGQLSLSVIEGDQETALDGRRIQAAGAAVVQINTGAGCHLDAAMVAEGLRALDPPSGSIVLIENVGNLVCPALFDLGEEAKVVISSVTEGADKPVKYPNMFRRADLVLVNKTDLLPYVDFDVRRHAADLRRISPGALMVELSATTGQGMQAWYDWLRRRVPAPHE
jgi:hydrogenase nickel incorporation protein HypB